MRAHGFLLSAPGPALALKVTGTWLSSAQHLSPGLLMHQTHWKGTPCALCSRKATAHAVTLPCGPKEPLGKGLCCGSEPTNMQVINTGLCRQGSGSSAHRPSLLLQSVGALTGQQVHTVHRKRGGCGDPPTPKAWGSQPMLHPPPRKHLSPWVSSLEGLQHHAGSAVCVCSSVSCMPGTLGRKRGIKSRVNKH